MSDADDLGRTRPTAATTLQNDGKTPAPVLPEEATGRFEGAVKELGRGGMGRVLEVRDVALDRPVALKELIDASTPAHRFVREARLTALLEHPGVIPIYELGQRRDGQPYYAMRRVQGGTLETALEAAVSLEDRLTLLPHLLDVVQTIGYAHSRGVLHRDLKPANVMVGKFGETTVLDWGLARLKVEPESEAPASGAPGAPPTASMSNPSATMEGASIGTPSYMSPEQALGEKGIDERSDVWSLGVMLFELLTGRGLYDAETAMAMLVKVANETPPTVRSIEPKAPKRLAEIADKALRKDRNERYSNAGEMAAALEEAMRVHSKPRPWGSWLGMGALAAIAVAAVLWPREQAVAPVHDGSALQAAVAAQLAERAQTAWEEGDIATAGALSDKAQGQPLAIGVRALAKASGPPLQLWSGPSAAGCAQLAVLPGMVACATFGGVELYQSGDGAPLPKISTGPTGWQHAIVSIPDEGLFAFGGDEGTVHVRRPNPAQVVQSLLGLPDGVRSLALSPDASELVVGLRDGSVMRWKRSEVMAKLLFKLSGPITAVAWSRDGLIAASGRDTTRVVRAEVPGTPLLEVDRPSNALAFASSWPLFLTAGRDVLGVIPGAPAHVFSGARHDVSALLVLGNRLVATSVDGAAQSWTTDGASLGALRTFEPGRIVLAPEPSRSGGAADFYAASGKSVAAWRWKRERFTQPPPELTGEATAFAFTADDSWCAGLRDGRLACGLPGRIPDAHRHAAAVVAVDLVKKGEGFVVLSAAQDGSVLLSAPGQELSTALSRKDRVPVAVALAPDASRLAVGWDDGTLVLFSLEFGKEIETLRDAPALALAFSPDGKMVAAARADKRAVVYLADVGRELQKLEGADGRVRAVAFSPDGKQVVGGGDDRRLSIWTVIDGRLTFTLTGAASSIGAVAWSSDGTRLAAQSDDGAVRVWAADDARPAVEVRGHFGDARKVAFGADGSILEAGSDGVPRRLELK